MDVMERLGLCGVVPVVVIEDAQDAVATARALLAGGVDVMEVTLRTPAALDAIRLVARECPGMCVGAGTVLSVEQGKAAVGAGARFIVSPGFDAGLVGWCLEQGVAVTPGCVTPGEITAALALGVKVLKFFPANVYGGLDAMKALAGPFGEVKFIPTGGVSAANLGEYLAQPFVHAAGGSWLCAKADIAAGNFDRITALCAQARQAVLGYEFAHMGINSADAETAQRTGAQFADAFGFAIKDGNSSLFASGAIEVVKKVGRGACGHIAVRTNSIRRAVADLQARGYRLDLDDAVIKKGRMIAAYLEEDFGGFDVHLLQK